jgi:nucleotide-binding universal stress UspA family protein
MFGTLIVPLDGTPFGEHALPLAAAAARRCGARLHLVHVHVPTMRLEEVPTVDSDKDAKVRLKERDYLKELSGRVAEHVGGIDIRTELLDGTNEPSLAAAIARCAESAGAELIVMSSHGRTGLARWWFGNVADDLVHRTSLPLLLTPALAHDPVWTPLPRLDRVLVPLDGAPLAEKVFDAVLKLGPVERTEVTLLRVVEPVPVPVVDPVLAPGAGVDAAVLDVQQQEAGTYLEQTAARLRARAPLAAVKTQVLLDAEPAEAIAGFLRMPSGDAAPFDLVALATHARSGLARLLFGSVAGKVFQHSTLPLLVQHPA